MSDLTTSFQLQLTLASEGRPGSSSLVVLPTQLRAATAVSSYVAGLENQFHSLVLTSELPAAEEVEVFVPELAKALAREKVKKATVCGIGRGSSVALALALVDTKLVRRVVLIDPTTRLAPGFVTRATDWIEQFLPLGLPLRNRSLEFDARPILHRIHCPTLVLTSPSATHYEKSQSEEIAKRIPNAWSYTLTAAPITAAAQFSGEACSLLAEFLQVPVKRSQVVQARENKVAANGTTS